MEKKIKIAIIGLGLIGSSILRGLCENEKYEIYAISKSSFKKAKKYTPNSSADINVAALADVVFVAVSINKTIQVLDEINSFLDKKTLVCDVASIKSGFLDKKYNFNFIPTHPMAGSEKSGFEAGDKKLFYGARWLVGKNDIVLEEIIKDLGAVSYKIDMTEHDKLCAQISHLPTILSYLLFDLASDNAKKIASSGFRDMTRLCKGEANLAMSMFKENEENINKYFGVLIEKFNNLKNKNDAEKMKIFGEIARKRDEMYDDNGKNIFKI